MTREEYQAVDDVVRRNLGEQFDFWIVSGKVGVSRTVIVRMTPEPRTVNLAVYAGPSMDSGNAPCQSDLRPAD